MDQGSGLAFAGRVREKRAFIANELLKRRDQVGQSFVCPSHITGGDDGIPLWSDHDLRILFPRLLPLERRDVRERCAICLAILVWMEWPLAVGAVAFENIFKACFHGADGVIDDRSLPLLDDDNRIFVALGGEAATTFLEVQYTFKPYVISVRSEEKEPVNAHRRPLPFSVEPKLINDSGGYGKIYVVKIASGCLELEYGCSSGTETIAYKHFKNKLDFAKERRILRDLKLSPLKHDHITRHLTDMVRAEQHYIFFRYTRLGDLEALFNAGLNLSLSHSNGPGKALYEFDKTFTSPPQYLFIEQMRNLASALSFLHNRSQIRSSGTVYAHFDLKPNNILVYPCVSGDSQRPNVGTWKLADFGIASLTRSNSVSQSPNDSLPSPYATQTRKTLNGPHRAPELQDEEVWANYLHCDEWAFGCVANEVFAFIDGDLGSNAGIAVNRLKEFRQKKEKATKGSGAWFQSDKAQGLLHNESLSLNSFIKDWLDTRLRENISWKKDMCSMILGALQITGAYRTTADQMFDELHKICQKLRSLEENSTNRRDLRPSNSTGTSGVLSYTSGPLGRPSTSATDASDARSRDAPKATEICGEVNLSGNKIVDLAVASDCSLVTYLYKKDSAFSISNFAPAADTNRGLKFRSEWPLPDKDCIWEKVALEGSLLIVRGRIVRGNMDIARVIKVRDPYKPEPFPIEKVPHNHPELIGSDKAIIWETEENRRTTICVWMSESDTVSRRSFEGAIHDIRLNTSSTLLYVWERRDNRHHLHMLDITLPEMPTSSESWLIRGDAVARVWPAQDERLCVIRDQRHKPRRLIVFGEPILHKMLTEPELKKGSASAMLGFSLITARYEKLPKTDWWSPSRKGICISRRDFDLDEPSTLGQEAEIQVAVAPIDDVDFKIACFSDNYTERFIVCGMSGRYYIRNDPIMR